MRPENFLGAGHGKRSALAGGRELESGRREVQKSTIAQFPCEGGKPGSRSPAGTPENSPPIYRWVDESTNQPSPAGDDRKSLALPNGFFRPYGTGRILRTQPTVETAGYCRSS